VLNTTQATQNNIGLKTQIAMGLKPIAIRSPLF